MQPIGVIMSLETDQQKESYALGISLAQNAVGLRMPLDQAALKAGFNAVIEGQKPEISEEEFKALIQALNEKIQKNAQAQAQAASSKFKEEGEAFLKENGAKEGVMTTESGLQYEIIAEGEGESPVAESKVKVHYEGKLLNGTVFDSSYQRNQPAEFGLNQVIKGWTEGLQLMKPGGVYRFFIPSDLAYGDRGAGQQIPPGSTLIFQVELLSIEA